jgi:ribonucleoside-diphosphate reductase alpha chain
MFVKKRNGLKQEFDTSKINKRILDMVNKHPKLDINVDEITNEVCNHIKDNITTSELDEFTSEVCAYRVTEHPDFDKLAARIIVSNNHKNSEKFANFSDMINLMSDVTGIVSPSFLELVNENRDLLDKTVNNSHEKDFENLTYFGFKTLEKSYLTKITHDGVVTCERPQHLWMRVALELNRFNINNALECYKYLSDFYFMHATPTLYNSGMKNNQFLSCFLLGVDDSITSMYEKLIANCAQISKGAGGIGIHISNIRAEGSTIKSTMGKSVGIIPFIKVLNEEAKQVTQGGGKRSGSFAIYLEMFHADISKFLELKKNNGSEKHRARDLFYALYICDLFMKRLIEAIENPDKIILWSLMCPNECPGLTEVYGDEFEKLYCGYEEEKKYREQVNILDLWKQIITSQLETSLPYIVYKDHVNNKSNQKNIGIIKSSNLCVTGDTHILTDKGQILIKELVDKTVNVWNGKEFSETQIKQTGTNQELFKITFSNGVELKCTPYHKFFIMKNYWGKPKEISANELKIGNTLIKYDLPIINLKPEKEMIYPYTHGLFCGDGTTYDNYSRTKKYPKLYLYGKKKLLLKYLDYESCTENKSNDRYDIVLPKNIDTKFTVPLDQNKNTILRWFEGYCDADGTIAKNGTNESLQISSIEKYFLIKIRLMLQTLGIDSKVTKNQDARKSWLPDGKGGKKEYECKEIYRLLIGSNDLYKLSNLGFEPKRLKFTNKLPQRNASQFIAIRKIEKLDQKEDTFCFTEPKRHMGMFNGVLTGQCTEITEYSSADEYASCTLSSIVLHKFVERDRNNQPFFNFNKLKHVTKIITRNLNNAINQNQYPCKEAAKSNYKHRPVAIGIQGLADLFIKMKYPYESIEAQQLNRDIFETIYFGSLETSHELALERQVIYNSLRNDIDVIADLSSQHEYLTYKSQQLTPESTKYEIELYNENKNRLKSCYEAINFMVSEKGLELKNNIIEGHIHIHELQFFNSGAYSTFKDSPISKGIFQFDMWKVTPSNRWNWTNLREKIMRDGICNSLVTGLMPTATTAQITGSNEAFEPITSVLYTRKVTAGSFMVINKYLQYDLIESGLWNEDLKNKIIEHRGSISNIDEISDEKKELYKTAWDIKKKLYIKMSADRGPYIDQSQSLNLFIAEPDYNILTSCHIHSWTLGLKTGMYYLRRKPNVDPVQFTIQKKRTDEQREKEIEENKNKPDDLLHDVLNQEIEGPACLIGGGCSS